MFSPWTHRRRLTSALDLVRWIGWAQTKAGEDWIRERELSHEQAFVLGYLVQNPGAIQRDIAAGEPHERGERLEPPAGARAPRPRRTPHGGRQRAQQARLRDAGRQPSSSPGSTPRWPPPTRRSSPRWTRPSGPPCTPCSRRSPPNCRNRPGRRPLQPHGPAAHPASSLAAPASVGARSNLPGKEQS